MQAHKRIGAALFAASIASHCGPDPLVFERDMSSSSELDLGVFVEDFDTPRGDLNRPDEGRPEQACSLDETECVDAERFRTCVANPSGETRWSQPSYCPFASCSASTGRCCGAPCSGLGATQCGGGGVQVCEDQSGCLSWSAPGACPEGGFCGEAGRCEAQCQSECALGERRCAGPQNAGAYQRCEDIGGGCLKFSAATIECGGGALCSGGECQIACQNLCSTMGDRRCVGELEQECVIAQSGCLDWLATGSPDACGPSCTDRCPAANMTRCDGNGDEQRCQNQSDGCLDWSGTGTRCQALQGCYSSTLATTVAHGECVQNRDDNMFKVCSDGSFGCLWARCNDGLWSYQCDRGEIGNCVNATTLYQHSSCPTP